jgi:7-cyano-7-deazaguanine reductase
MADNKLLEVFPNPHPDRNYLIAHLATEFTSVCPVTGQPDFATIEVRYVADNKCIELRSFKRYLQSFRNDGIYYEDVTNTLLNDLVAICAPRWMELTTRWTVRGGISTVVTVQHGDSSVAPSAR